jgi:hypothetical protein
MAVANCQAIEGADKDFKSKGSIELWKTNYGQSTDRSIVRNVE